MTSNMMSMTAKCTALTDRSKEEFPCSTTYNTHTFNTISNPMVTGGAPNNQLTLIKFQKARLAKAMNPFKVRDYSPDRTFLEETSNLGPGLYFPEKARSIGGSDFEKSRRAMYSTISAKKATAASPNLMINTYSGMLPSVS